MKNNTINFSDLESLKRYENKCAIYTDSMDKVIVVYGKENIEKTIKEIERPVLVYNPNVEVRVFIINLFVKNMVIGEEGKVSFNISNVEVITELLSKVTNIDLGLDINNEDHKKNIENILSDPSDLLIATNDIITEISKTIMKRWTGSMIELQNMPKAERDIYIEEVESISLEQTKVNEEPIISEKEKRKLELQKQIEELDKED